MTAMPLELVHRIADRANDPLRRTFMAGAEATAQPIGIASLLKSFEQSAAPAARGLLDAFGKLSEMVEGSGVKAPLMMGPGGVFTLGGVAHAGPRGLDNPPSDAALAIAEAKLGFALPPELRQLYAIGDGGFGPGEGLFPLAKLVEHYKECTDEPFGPMRLEWPAHLLPLFDEDPVLVCLDLESLGIVAWDPEEIEDEESEEDWLRSFKPEQASLAELMGEWLERPAFGE